MTTQAIAEINFQLIKLLLPSYKIEHKHMVILCV